MEMDGLRSLIARHAASTNVLVALGMALDARVTGRSLGGDVATTAEAILHELGAADVVVRSTALDLAPVLAGIRADLFFGSKILADRSAEPGWRHLEPQLLQAFGDVSAGFPLLLKQQLAPQLADLGLRLGEPGAAFLDIGVGVGALSIAMLRQWPQLKVVGVDPWSAALVLAEANLHAAGLADSVELRIGSGEDVPDSDRFDLAFVPTAFIPESPARKIIERVRTALRPGGWVLVATVNPGSDALGTALARFRTTMWGGTVFADGATQRLLESFGYFDCRILSGPAGAPIAFAAGRRA